MPQPASHQLGLLGGTFDPPHLGHRGAALAVLAQLGLHRVDLLVANDPWQKSGDRAVSPAAVRLEMARALVTDTPGLGVDDREIRRGGPTYTADTLEDILRESPDTEIFLIVGADTAGRIHSWHRPEVVLALSTLVIVNRTDHAPDIPGVTGVYVQMDPVNVSSTVIRQRVAAGESLDNFTTPEVARIIAQNNLYKAQQ
ncbi:MAG: nicotinate (nicotinamide) nucleotide adenylyltransferase [Acidimicrobiaceae bacterium]